METQDSLLAFWFGESDDDAQTAATQAALWWGKNPDTDAAIRQRFAPLLPAARKGELNHWCASPKGTLALILLTDQIPRNSYRGTANAFAFDDIALALCRQGLAAGQDRALRPVERVFFYLPLEHAEDPAHQAHSVQLFRELADAMPTAQQAVFESFADYALRHQAVITRFGRFPHRNAILGRTSSAEETAFLAQPGSSF
ncbi:DUF924 domain-containing protein [Aquitalea sp. S1-19]|nr:DUF924 domain-containing protein [Aquitalea sp. S1-19]